MSEQPANAELVPVQDTLPMPTSSEPDIGRLLLAAVDKGFTPEQLKVLTDLQIQLEDRRAKAAFNRAMAQFRTECPVIVKRHVNANPKFSGAVSRDGVRGPCLYAALEDITRVIDPVVAANGLNYGFGGTTEATDAGVTVTCTVTHGGGHSESATITMPVDDRVDQAKGANRPQRLYGTITYAKKALLALVFGLSPVNEDDDGHSLSGGDSPGATISEEQARDIQDLLDTKEVKVARFLAWAKAKTVVDIPASTYEQAVAFLKTMEPKK